MVLLILFGAAFVFLSGSRPDSVVADEPSAEENRVFGEVYATDLHRPATAVVEGVGTLAFEPGEVETKRADLFQPGHFSLFDVLVHLHEQGHFDLEYHFDETMNTYVIDSLDGQTGCWYNADYDEGWPELSVFRMDHYPVAG